ncbi:Transcription antitermination protein NusB [Phycisphaerales bacterium]|nr:Transcription antitermination protein NusB [Phycisphaerales bacterium]
MSGADPIHRLAFEALLQPPGIREQHLDTEKELASISPAERERAFHIAARRLAFQVLYEVDAGSGDVGRVRELLAGVEGLGPVILERIATLVHGAYEHRAEADAEFQTLAPDWPAHRQAAVDRAILRLAHYEMSAGLAPVRVVVSEAVELAKHFSTEKSPAFINALLDRVLKRLCPEEVKE